MKGKDANPLLNVPYAAQKRLGFGLFTYKKEVPNEHGTTGVDGTEVPLPAVFEAVNPEFATQASREVGQQGWRRWYSDFEELRADRALFFRDHLSSGGRFSLSYLARVIAEGDTIAPPAKVEEMYHPDNFGLSASWQVETK